MRAKGGNLEKINRQEGHERENAYFKKCPK
jgi:hypothetical protein